MTVYLLDTNIVSLLAPSRHRTAADEQLVAWIESHGHDRCLSVITAAEIRYGIDKARHTGAFRKAALLDRWWIGIVHYWSAHILPFDLPTATETGRLLGIAKSAGLEPGFEDAAIAATASMNRLTVLTRNVKHFRPLGVAFVNPFDRLPSSHPG